MAVESGQDDKKEDLKAPEKAEVASFRDDGDTSEETFYIDLRPRLIRLPKFDDKKDINIRYPVIPPFAFVHIYWSEEDMEIMYEIEEPLLSETEKEILNLIQLGLEEMINVSFVRASKYNLIIKYLEKNVQSILIELGARISKKSYQKIMYYIYRDSVGLNEIEPMLKDYYIEDIECNGTGFPIYIVHRVYENLRTNVLFTDGQKHMDFIEKMAQKCSRYVSFAKPLLDGTLPDGSRVNATYTDDITTRGPTFTIRKFTKDPWTPAHLIKSGTACADLYAFIWMAIEEKFSMMVVGETASGKTTFLNSVVNFMPPEARICSIEDTRELNLAHLNWLPAVSREGFGIPNLMGDMYGEVSLFALLKESFRQNPDYVIVGEVRGKEAFVLFQGMASGHPSYGTFHAGSVETLMRRLQTPPISISPALCETLDLVAICVHIKHGEKGVRRVRELAEIKKSYEDGSVDYNPVFSWDPITDKIVFNGNSVIIKKLATKIGKTEEQLLDEIAKRSALLQTITDKNIMDFKDFSRVIHSFFKDSDVVYKQFGIK
ncbi:secretion system protein E [Candidatus Woesearchaeota archaeon CG08_land_8_20_14_0_20_43_7]|nr:MAG: secretion system protein E [Candidatus Woesearchaeota archaeon CG08_land_8_20_14_0_20_43_7]